MYDLKEVTMRIWNVYGWNVGADGYKDIAKRMGLPRSAVRYGRQALQMCIGPAVMEGWISDQRVVGMLHALPLKLARLIVRIETKLRRKLTRSRLGRLIREFEVARANRLLRWVEARHPRNIPVNITNWKVDDHVY